MTIRKPLPPELGTIFHTSTAIAGGATKNRLRAADLSTPFIGVRVSAAHAPELTIGNEFERQAAQRRNRNREYAPLLSPGQFLSHESAAAQWRAPLPLVLDDDGEPADLAEAPVHVTVYGSRPLPRSQGVRGHRDRNLYARTVALDGIQVSNPACTWASLGTLALDDLVALGDFFCRVWRVGFGRRDAGKPALATVDQLRAEIDRGRRIGVRRLREAVELIREDSWSPRESKLRVLLWQWALPEPELNFDVFDDDGTFLGCVDLAYPELRIAIEYHGRQHAASYAKDVERIAALRAAGWIVIEVTAELMKQPERIVDRVRAAMRSRRALT